MLSPVALTLAPALALASDAHAGGGFAQFNAANSGNSPSFGAPSFGGGPAVATPTFGAGAPTANPTFGGGGGGGGTFGGGGGGTFGNKPSGGFFGSPAPVRPTRAQLARWCWNLRAAVAPASTIHMAGPVCAVCCVLCTRVKCRRLAGSGHHRAAGSSASRPCLAAGSLPSAAAWCTRRPAPTWGI
jgi:hypothetical protein